MVTVDTRVMGITLSVPMATVAFVGEENIVVVVVLAAAFDVVPVVGMELEVTINDVVDDVVMELESDEDADDKI
jgi:hypothetical protein